MASYPKDGRSSHGNSGGEIPLESLRGRHPGPRTGVAMFAWMLRWMPRRLVYCNAVIPVVWYFFFRPELRRSSRTYQRMLGLRHGPLRRWWFTLRQALAYAHVILDNMYLGRFGPGRFRMNFLGTEIFRSALGRGRGLILLSAHAGNWHLAVNFLGRTGTRAHMVTDELRSPAVRRHMDAAKRNATHLTVHQADEGPALVVRLRSALESGEVVALSGDRALGGKQIEVPFLGGRARFPLLGFALARATGAPVCLGLAFSTGLQRYDFIGIGPINDEIAEEGSARGEDERLARVFADRLAEQLRRFPPQWFNFFDFWEA